jgi:hypothetical protein
MSQSFPHSPTLVERAQRYAAALWRHAKDGLRITSAEEIARRLAICQNCPSGEFDGAGCRVCGCPVNSTENSLRNKLAMASETCPRGHWQAEGATAIGAPRLTVGMCMVDDFDGVFFTVQALNLYHRELRGQLEILVIDNRPRLNDHGSSPEAAAQTGETPSQRVRNLLAGIPNGRYIPYTDRQGTAARDQVFEQARGEVVICVDSHVLIAPGALLRTLVWLDAHPEFRGLFQGPLEYDNGSISTHQVRTWGAGMLGQWSHDVRYTGDDGEVLDIDLQGLGLFGCRRADWLGFNPHFREFGAEEGYLHDKYRRADRSVVCLPWLRWLHRFQATGQHAHYASSMRQRIKNYVHGRIELDQDLDDIHAHFYGVAPYGLGRDPQEWIDLLRECDAECTVARPVRREGRAVPSQAGPTSPVVARTDHPTPVWQVDDQAAESVAGE